MFILFQSYTSNNISDSCNFALNLFGKIEKQLKTLLNTYNNKLKKIAQLKHEQFCEPFPRSLLQNIKSKEYSRTMLQVYASINSEFKNKSIEELESWLEKHSFLKKLVDCEIIFWQWMSSIKASETTASIETTGSLESIFDLDNKVNSLLREFNKSSLSTSTKVSSSSIFFKFYCKINLFLVDKILNSYLDNSLKDSFNIDV